MGWLNGKRRRQRPTPFYSPRFPMQGNMLGNNIVPYSPFGYRSPWGRGSQHGCNRNQMRNSARLMNALRGPQMSPLLNPYGNRSPLGDFGHPGMPTYGRGGFGGFSGGLGRRGPSMMGPGYGMRGPPFRSPYMGPRLGAMGGYRMPRFRRHPSFTTRGYPPFSRQHGIHASRWYDDGMTDEEDDDDYNPYYNDESEDDYYRPTYGRQRSYAQDYDYDGEDGYFDDEDDDDFDEDYYDDPSYHRRPHPRHAYGNRREW